MGKYYIDEELDDFASNLVTGYINGTESRETIVEKLSKYYFVEDKSPVLNALDKIDRGDYLRADVPHVKKAPSILSEVEPHKVNRVNNISKTDQHEKSASNNKLKGAGLIALGIAVFILTFAFITYLEWDLIPCILSCVLLGGGLLSLIGGIDILGKDNPRVGNIERWITIVFYICIFAIIMMGCVNFFSDIDSGPDYETYYIDDNGNGKLDRGEGNYTTDEDGNVVDWDEDGNNFE